MIFTDESSSLFGRCPTSAGVKGTLSESEGYILANLVVTASAILLTVYFLVWQTYVLRIDVIVSSVLLVAFGIDGLLAIGALTRLARLDSVTLVVIVDFRGGENPRCSVRLHYCLDSKSSGINISVHKGQINVAQNNSTF